MRGAKARRFAGGARGETALGVCPRPGLRGEARRRARTGVVQVVHLVQRLHQPRGVAHELVALLCAAARQQAKDTGLSAFGPNTAQRRRICAPAARSARAARLWRCESARGTSRAASGARRGSAPSPWLLPAARLHAAPLRHRPANRHESRRPVGARAGPDGRGALNGVVPFSARLARRARRLPTRAPGADGGVRARRPLLGVAPARLGFGPARVRRTPRVSLSRLAGRASPAAAP
jgi:hypothetical protein